MGTAFSTYYISLSIFLGFAISFPDMQVLLYFIIPIKIKWLAYLDVALLAYSMITSIHERKLGRMCCYFVFPGKRPGVFPDDKKGKT